METTERAKPTTRVMLVTPELAEKWMKKNISNRPLRAGVLRKLISELEKGEWALTSNGVGFDYNHNLQNGQHRLLAIIHTGISAEIVVVWGLKPEAYNVTDTGCVRGGGDALAHLGVTSPNSKSGIIKCVISLKNGKLFKQGGVKGIDNSEVVAFYEKTEEKADLVHEKTLIFTKNFKLLPLRFVGALYWHLSDINVEYADAFFEKYGSGKELTDKHPILILRDKLMDDKMAKQKYPTADTVAWVIIAWNAFRTGKKISTIRWDNQKDGVPKAI